MSFGGRGGLTLGASRRVAGSEHVMAVVVRYQAKPERADENQKLIEAVFADLEARDAQGFTFKVFEHDDVDKPDSLQDVPAFQAFVADIADRCEVPPLAMGATVVGSWR